MALVPVKITINGHGVRRLNVTRDSSFEQFQKTVKELFGIQNDLDWLYIDEENDEVTFSTEQEFRDALTVWNENNILRLTATTRPIVVEQRPIGHPRINTDGQAAPAQCPFARISRCASAGADRCTASFPVRYGLPLVLFYSIFTHPFLTFFALAGVMIFTKHRHPEAHDKLAAHAKNHWRKVAVAYGLYMLFNCRICTLLLAIPVGYYLVQKFKQCHNSQNGECCYVKVRDQINRFIHNGGIDKIVQFGRNITQAPASVQQAPQVQENPKQVLPSAPLLYPEVPEVSETVLPQRIETSTPYQKELTALENMGFTNKKLNEHLIRNFNGNLDRVVSSLIQLSDMK